MRRRAFLAAIAAVSGVAKPDPFEPLPIDLDGEPPEVCRLPGMRLLIRDDESGDLRPFELSSVQRLLLNRQKR